MTDISKCQGKKCKVKKNCYRFTAPSGYWQSYSDFYEDIKDGKCKWFWYHGPVIEDKK